MKISKTTGYALIVMGHIAEHNQEGPIRGQDISEEYNLSVVYLLKILNPLVKAGILRSKRGPTGGYTLAKPAKNISMLEIIEAVNGPMITPTYLAEVTHNEAFSIKPKFRS